MSLLNSCHNPVSACQGWPWTINRHRYKSAESRDARECINTGARFVCRRGCYVEGIFGGCRKMPVICIGGRCHAGAFHNLLERGGADVWAVHISQVGLAFGREGLDDAMPTQRLLEAHHDIAARSVTSDGFNEFTNARIGGATLRAIGVRLRQATRISTNR